MSGHRVRIFQSPLDPANVTVRRLLIQRHGVMHGSWDAGDLQLLQHGFTVICLDGELAPDAGSVGTHGGRRNVFNVVQKFQVTFARCGALFHFPVKPFQLGQHNSALQGVHATAHTDAGVVITALLAMYADFTHGLGERVVASENGAAVAVAAQWLARKKTGTADGRQVAALAPLVRRTKALRRIFDDRDITVPGGDGIDLVHVGNLTIERYRHDCLGFRCNRRFDQFGIDVAGIWFDVDEDRSGTQQHDNFGSRHKGERRGNDFIARLDAQGHQRYQQCFGAGGNRDAVLSAGIGFQLFFQFPHFWAHDVLAMVQHTLDAGIYRLLKRGILRLEVDKIDFFGHSATHVVSLIS